MSNPTVSVIIVNYNGRHLLSGVFTSLRNSSYDNMEVIVVDNGSLDGSTEYIKKRKIKKKEITLIENKQNVGFAKANNQGAVKAKGDFVLLLNNDAILSKDTIAKLILEFSDETVSVVQPKILFYYTKELQSGAAFYTSLGFLYYFGFGHRASDPCYNKSMDMFSANGACMMIRKSVIEHTGLFDVDFFAYYEETDFCHRVLLSGGRVIYVPTTSVWHKGGQTSMTLAEAFIFFHSFKNRLTSTIKNFQSLTLAKALLPLMSLYIFLFFIYLIRGKINLSNAIARAIFWNVMQLRTILHKRRRIQRLRKLRDDSYLKTVGRPVNIRYYYNMLRNKNILLENEC